MKSKLPRRRSIRIRDYDYSQPGHYFVTICAHNKINYFGSVAYGKMTLNSIGQMIDKWWNKLPDKFCNTMLHEYVIMPNHMHAIVEIADQDKPSSCRGETTFSPTLNIPNQYNGLGRRISWFKRMSTNEYIRLVKAGRVPVFKDRFWQRNYWEHVIRNEKSMYEICDYIITNPERWEKDSLHNGESVPIQGQYVRPAPTATATAN